MIGRRSVLGGALTLGRALILGGALAVGGAPLLGPGPARAQGYPTHPIRFLVPFPAGSATDALARIVGAHASRSLGQPVVVENMAGGNGVIAAQAAARAPADGYTVLISTNTTHGSNQALLKSVPYDAVADYEPVTKLGTIALALIAHPSVPAKSVPELLAYARANPGKLTFGYGSGSSRMAGEMLRSLGEISLTDVPYRGNPQAIADLIGGQISLVFADIATTLPQVKNGKAVGLAVSTPRRSALAPDLPTMVEAGVAGYDLAAWFAAFVPARTPRPVVDRLREAFVAALGDAEVREKLLVAGIEPESSTPEELGAFVRAEITKWGDLVRKAGIKPE